MCSVRVIELRIVIVFNNFSKWKKLQVHRLSSLLLLLLLLLLLYFYHYYFIFGTIKICMYWIDYQYSELKYNYLFKNLKSNDSLHLNSFWQATNNNSIFCCDRRHASSGLHGLVRDKLKWCDILERLNPTFLRTRFLGKHKWLVVKMIFIWETTWRSREDRVPDKSIVWNRIWDPDSLNWIHHWNVYGPQCWLTRQNHRQASNSIVPQCGLTRWDYLWI